MAHTYSADIPKIRKGLFALLIWSSGATATCFFKELPIFESLTISYGVGFCFSLCHMLIKQDFSCFKKPLSVWALVAFVSLGQYLYVLAYQYCPPAQADIIIYLWPVISLALAPLLGKFAFKLRYGVALAIGALSVCMLSFQSPQTGASTSLGGMHVGYLLALLCAFFWGTYAALVREIPCKIDIHMAGFGYGIAALIAFSAHMGTESFVMPTGSQMLGLLYYAVPLSLFSFVLWVNSMDISNETAFLTICAYFKPSISLVILFLFGFIDFSIYVGYALIMAMSASLIANGWFAVEGMKTFRHVLTMMGLKGPEHPKAQRPI